MADTTEDKRARPVLERVWEARRLFLDEIQDLVPEGGDETVKESIARLVLQWCQVQEKLSAENVSPPATQFLYQWWDGSFLRSESPEDRAVYDLIKAAVDSTVDLLRRLHLDGYTDQHGKIAVVSWVRALTVGTITAGTWQLMPDTARGFATLFSAITLKRPLEEQVFMDQWQSRSLLDPRAWGGLVATHRDTGTKIPVKDFWPPVPYPLPGEWGIGYERIRFPVTIDFEVFDRYQSTGEEWIKRARKEGRERLYKALADHVREAGPLPRSLFEKRPPTALEIERDVAWFARFQVGGIPKARIASSEYRPHRKPKDVRAVQNALHTASKIIGLPMRSAPGGRPKKTTQADA